VDYRRDQTVDDLIIFPLEWGAWMEAAQAGDAALYRRLLTEIGVWLMRQYADHLPPSLAVAARRNTLLAIHQKRHTYDPVKPFEPWLIAIMIHASKGFARR
jgi:DNA-directed RNA polymerase specialized sigma24 family protein